MIGQKTQGLENPSCYGVFKNHVRKMLVVVVKKILKLEKDDTHIYKAQSTRLASQSTTQRFYNKDVAYPEENFQNTQLRP